MNKQTLIEKVSNKTGQSKKETTEALKAILETISEALEAKDSVTLIGFGTFHTVAREAREVVVPSTGNKVKVPAKTVVKFKVGKALKETVA